MIDHIKKIHNFVTKAMGLANMLSELLEEIGPIALHMDNMAAIKCIN